MCTCPTDIQNLTEMCEECQRQLQEDAPVPIEVEDTRLNEDEDN